MKVEPYQFSEQNRISIYHITIAYKKKNNSENHTGKEQKNMKNGYKSSSRIQYSDVVASRSKQSIFFSGSFW